MESLEMAVDRFKEEQKGNITIGKALIGVGVSVVAVMKSPSLSGIGKTEDEAVTNLAQKYWASLRKE